VPLILSGGLNQENVAEAIAVVRPFAVDVASGVERSPGRKDYDKLEAFAAAVASTAVEPLSAR
jgi:phosphoribosylanthranilate isomerase